VRIKSTQTQAQHFSTTPAVKTLQAVLVLTVDMQQQLLRKTFNAITGGASLQGNQQTRHQTTWQWHH
jgi:hypothetical protein